jgi:hypothetical protein
MAEVAPDATIRVELNVYADDVLVMGYSITDAWPFTEGGEVKATRRIEDAGETVYAAFKENF